MNAGTITAVLNLDASNFSSGIKSAQQQLQTFSNSSNNLGDRMIGLGAGMTALGGTLTKGVTLPLIGIGTAAVKVASDFEAAMSNVQAISSSSAEDMQLLSEKAKEMGSTTKYSATESAEAFQYMALAGWDTQQMLNSIEGVLNLAASANMDLAQASDIVTDYISAFSLEAEDATRISDLFAYAQANSNTNVQQLADAFGNCSVLAASYGYSMEEVTGALGLFADRGLKGSEAGTALNAVMRDIVNNMKDGYIEIGNTNVAVTDANGSFLSYAEIVKGVEKATQGMTDAERAAALQKTFTAYSIKGVNMLLAAGSEELSNFTEELYNSEGAGKQMAETMQNNLQGKITAFKSALEGAGIAIGEVLIPHLTKIVEKFTGVVQGFNKLNPNIQESIVKYGLLAAAIGPVLSIAGKMTMGIGGLVKGFSLLGSGVSTAVSAMGGLGSVMGLITGPIGIATGVIVAAVVAWKTNFAGFRDACKSIFEDLGRIFNTLKDRYINLWNDIKDAWDNDLGGIQTMLTTGWENVTTVFESTFKAIADIFDLFADAFEGDWNGVWENVFSITNGLMDGFQEAWSNSLDTMISVLENWFPSLEGKLDKLPDIFNKVWDFIQEGMNIGIENVRLTFEAIGKIFEGDFGGAFDLFKNRWSEAWDVIVDKIITSKNTISEKLAEIKDEANESGENLKEKFSDKFTELKESIAEKITEMSQSVSQFFQELPSKMGYGLGNSIENIKNWASNLYDTMSNKIPEIINNIGTWFSELPGKISEWFSSATETVSQWASDVGTKATEAGKNIIDSIGNSLRELPSKVTEWFSETTTAISNWASNAGSSVKEAGTNIVNSITDGFKELPNKMFEFGMSSIQKLWDGIKSAAGFLGNLFNDIFGDFFSGAGLGAAMADFTQTFNGYMQELGSSAKDAFGNIVNDLESGAINVEQFGISVEQYLAGAISTMSDMGVSAEDLAAAINQIPEEKRAEVIALITGKEESEELKSAIEQVEGKSVDVNANTTGTEGVSELDQAIEGTEGKDVDVNAKVGGTGEVKELDSSIRQVPPTKDATVTATTKGLGALQTMQSTIAGINSKTVTITAIMNGNVTQNAPGGGKWTLATGTENANSGLTEVAEYGPELIMSRSGASAYLATERQLFNMEGGERVFNARQTSEILRSAAERNSTKNNSNIEKLLNEAITRLDRIKDATNNNSIEVTKAIENKELVSNVNLDSNSLAKGITPSVEKEQGNRMLLYKRGVLV